MIVLLEKSGGVLFLHSFFHTEVKGWIADNKTSVEKYNSGCSCIDDFNLPFTKAAILENAEILFCENIFLSSISSFPTLPATVFFSLRAPPASFC
mgnify:CR=1 FL=1